MKKLVLIAMMTLSTMALANITNNVNIIGNSAYVTLTNDLGNIVECNYHATWRTSLLDWRKSFGETKVNGNESKTIVFVEKSGYPISNFRFTLKDCK